MDSLTSGVSRFTDAVMGWLPQLLGAFLILVIGAIAASLLHSAIYKLLTKINLTDRLHGGQGGTMISKAVPAPEPLIARIVYWAIMLGVISLAVSVLGIPALTAFVAAIYSYLPRLLAAFLIFLVAGAVAAGLSALAMRTLGDTPTGKIVATAVPFIVMGIATFMILDQLGIAETIVTITYAALMGAIALGLALAFGLGGRTVAARLLEDAYEKGLEQQAAIKRDLAIGRQRAKEEARRLRDRQKR